MPRIWTVTGLFATGWLLTLGALEIAFEMIDLCDQLLQTLPDILALLVCLEQLALEAADALGVLVELPPKHRGRFPLTGECIREGRNGTLEPIEVVDVARLDGNRTPPSTEAYPG
ncbi:MAG: hypothetical protein GY772_12145 [bacterium]|nr:hypothetical protein [bacterium]